MILTPITITHLGAETCVTGACPCSGMPCRFPAGPAVIIAGSGMCTGGRIVNHLKHGLDDPKNDLFFVGYQAKGTPGRDILEGRTPAKAAIHRLSGYSAHADQQTLCDRVTSMPEPPGEIRLIHGEPEA